MKVIIAGGRNFSDRQAVAETIDASGFEITECVCGGARGADLLGALICHDHKIPIRLFPADWDTFGKAAGHIRNRQMAEYADALILMPGDTGSDNMLTEARRHGLTIYESKRRGT
jgi:hypothetical protein